MDNLNILEDAMRVLDLISMFLHEESEYFIDSKEVRGPLQAAFDSIHDIYERLIDDSLIEDMQTWGKDDEKDILQ